MDMIQITFEIVPVKPGAFDPFVMDVPQIPGRVDENRAARRAYVSAMAYLAPRGIDIEDFQVFTFENETRGRAVTMAGITA